MLKGRRVRKMHLVFTAPGKLQFGRRLRVTLLPQISVQSISGLSSVLTYILFQDLTPLH